MTATSIASTVPRSLRGYYHYRSDRNDLGYHVLNIILLIVFIVGCAYKCWWHCSPNGLARDRREREEKARGRIKEYKSQRQSEVSTNSDGGNGDEIEFRIYECCYQGSTSGKGNGYGHGELHIAISSQINDDNGRRLISGCGMRELEYTEIISGYIDSNGNAEWAERTRRKISYNPPQGSQLNNDLYYEQYTLPYHWGPVTLRSKGKFINHADDGGGEDDNNDILTSFEGEYYGRDECNCRECRVFWTRWSNTNESGVDVPQATILGETVRWCPTPDEGGRKIGDYILFRLKADGQSGGRPSIWKCRWQ